MVDHRGKMITNLYELQNAVHKKRSVFCPHYYVFRNPIPAAFVINLSGQMILNLINEGIYLYKKTKGEKKW